MTNPNTHDVTTILVVDESQLEQRYIARLLEAHGGWRTTFARNSFEALASFGVDPPALVMVDMLLPNGDGLTLVGKLREKCQQVPIVLMTGAGSEGVAVEALKAGAADYVPKQALAHDLLPVLDRVLSVRQAEHRRFRVLAGMTRRSSQFVLENDTSLVPPLIAMFREDLLEIGLCDLMGATRTGIALEEALLNAIYHGNLEVSSELRESGDDAFHQVAAARRSQMPYRDRRVKVTARMSPVRAAFVIVDQGPGFDVSKITDPTDQRYIHRPSGRGVLLMRAFMSEVRYNSVGNRVTLIKKRYRVANPS
jgi:CheY-like chemotaxis protein